MFDLISQPRQYGALLLSIVSSLIIYARRILVLNKFVLPPTPVQGVGAIISILSGMMFWLSLNAVDRELWLQLLSGGWSTVLAWVVYTMLVNERLRLPTTQQWISLAFYAVTEVCLLFQVRLVLSNT